MKLDVAPAREDRLQEILSPEALDFVAELHGRFGARRRELLAARRERAAELARGGTLDFLARDARDPRGRLAGRRAARATTPTGAWRSPARPTASS